MSDGHVFCIKAGQLDPPVSDGHVFCIKAGQLDPPVSDGHVFASKEVSWILLLVNVPEMQKRSYRNTKVQLHKSFNSVVQPDSVQLLPLT